MGGPSHRGEADGTELSLRCVAPLQSFVRRWPWLRPEGRNAAYRKRVLGAKSALGALVLLIASSIGAQELSFGSRTARPAPDWLNRASIYELWLDAFTTEANLHGAIARLPKIAELGATIVYLGPIAKFTARPQGSPYSVADYNEIDPELGTAEDLHQFVKAAHNLHLRVMLDIVYYHSAPDNVLVREHPEYFVKTADGRIARGFWPQPTPDFRNAALRKYLVESLVHWVRDFDVDGFRCDVGAGVPVSFWSEARKALDATKPDVVMLSEADRPEDQLQAFDISYNFQYYLTLVSVLRDGAPAIRIREQWESMRGNMPRGARLLHYDDNHDWPRAVLQFGRKGAMAAQVLNFTLDGIPFIYNGQEIDDPGPTSWRRPLPIRWQEQLSGTNEKNAGTVLEQYKSLFAMRANEPALTSGDLIWINNTQPNSVLSFLRKKGDSEILAMVNLSNRQVHVTIDLPVMDYYAVQNLLKPDKTWFQLYSGRISADLGAYESIVGKRIPAAPYEPEH